MFDVSRETLARLDRLVHVTDKWQRAINLVSRASMAAIWHRHIADSAQLFGLAPVGATRWADLGAGGGYPGLVLAAMAHDARPALRLTLVESDARKAAFLAEAARAMGVVIDLHACRVAALPPDLRFDVVSARALAPLPRLLPMARPLLAPGGVMLFPKGADAEVELEALQPIDRDAATRIASVTDPAATILKWT